MKDETLKIEVTINGVKKHGMVTPMDDKRITQEDFDRLWNMLYRECSPYFLPSK